MQTLINWFYGLFTVKKKIDHTVLLTDKLPYEQVYLLYTMYATKKIKEIPEAFFNNMFVSHGWSKEEFDMHTMALQNAGQSLETDKNTVKYLN